MKLLVLSNNPSRPSFRQRIEMFIDPLRERGIKCFVHKLPKCYVTRWKLFKSAADFDAVLLHKKCLNIIDARRLRKNAKKIIYDFDDAVMYKASNPDAENTSHMRLFERTAKLSDSIIASNEYLAAYARRFNSNVHIIPTGLVVDDYKISAAKPNDGKIRLVWMGSSATLGYLEQLKEPLEETGKLFDNVVLRIVCDRFPALSNIAVEQRKWSVETQVADLVTSDIGLAPLPDNRFTRGKCAYKILQYMAAGLPTIASPVGANQEYIEKSNAGLLAVDKDQWLDSITTLIKDEKLRTQMAGNANDFVGQFDRAVFVEKFSSAVKDCVNKS